MRLLACIADMLVLTSARVQVITAWELDSAAVVDELILLATDRRLIARMHERPSRLTEIDPLLCRARTPIIYDIFRGLLFVCFSHNLLLESYVSRMKRLERGHPGMHALTLDHLFKFKVAQERPREERKGVRSMRGGGLRQSARELAANGYGSIGAPNGSKLKQHLLLEHIERAATRHTRAYLRGRGRDSPRNLVRAAHAAYAARKQLTAQRVLASRRRTCTSTRTGRARAIWTASECRLLLGVAAMPLFNGAKVKKMGKNVWKLEGQGSRDGCSLGCARLSLSLSL